MVWTGSLVLVFLERNVSSKPTWDSVLVAALIIGSLAMLLGWISFMFIVGNLFRDKAVVLPFQFQSQFKQLSSERLSSFGESCLRIHFIFIVLSLGLLTRTGLTSDSASIFVISLAHFGQVCLNIPITVTMTSLIVGASTTCLFLTPPSTCESALRAASCILAATLIYSRERSLQDSFAKWTEISNKYDIAQITADVDAISAARNIDELRLIIGNTAHDLKTPLQAFCFSTTELIASLKEVKKICFEKDERLNILVLSAIEAAQNLMTYSEFMNMSINRSLDFTKSTHGISLSPSFSSFNLVDAIKYPVECMRAIQVRMSIVLELDTPENDHIITDGHWLKDNLICLLSNAVKYSIDGDVRLRCKIVTHLEKDGSPEKFLKFEVEDHGIGVTKLQRESLFQPFARTQNQAGGTGLGLYSLSKRIQALGGTFGIEGRSDGTHGSLVWFTFPYRQDSMQHYNYLSTTPTTAITPECSMDIDGQDSVMVQPGVHAYVIEHSSGSDSRKKILIVDDSPLIIKMLRRSLEAASYDVVVAENGAEACEIYDAHPREFGAIVTDIQMPVISLDRNPLQLLGHNLKHLFFSSRSWTESS
jgi:signal transduction histidine kinase